MSTITNPPTPVNDGRTAEQPQPDTRPRIDINEAMLSPFADADHARWMIGELFARGWSAQYRTIRPAWAFNSYDEAARFRHDFDEILHRAAAAFVWPITIYDADEATYVGEWATVAAAVDVDSWRNEMGES